MGWEELIDPDVLGQLQQEPLKFPDVVRKLIYTKNGSDPLGKPIQSWVEETPAHDIPARMVWANTQEFQLTGEQQQTQGTLMLPLEEINNIKGIDRVRLYQLWNNDPATRFRDLALEGEPTVNALELVVEVRQATGEQR